MRIELDEKTVKILDEIRVKNWRITGRGHSDTVRYLANYYLENKAVNDLLKELRAEIPDIIERAFGRAMRTALTNLFAKVAAE